MFVTYASARTVCAVTSTLLGPASSDVDSAPGLPIVKWVGGKHRLLESILANYTGQTRVVEPFLGGGALSIALSAQYPDLEVYANDKIAELIEIYRAVAGDVEGFITAVEAYAAPYLACPDKASRRAHYYEIREAYMSRTIDGPVPLFFLLWCAYSGMYRTGMKYPGRFNTPHGFGKEKAGFYHPTRLRLDAPLIAKWHLSTVDFADLGQYLDPPYRETYSGYTASGFSEIDQLRVVEFAHLADAKGATFVYSNKYQDDGFYENNFHGFDIRFIDVRHQVNHNAATVGRPKVAEVLITNHRADPASVTSLASSTILDMREAS